MEGRHCWPMQIYCSAFVTIVERKSQVFCNILYSCLKRIHFSFKTQPAHFLQADLLLESVSSHLEFFMRWEAFSEISSHERVFLKSTKPLVSMSSPPSMVGQYFLGFSEFRSPVAAALVRWNRGLSVPGYRGWVLQTAAIRMRRRIHSFFIFRSTLEIILKKEMHMDDPCSNFVSLHPFTHSKDLDARLYFEVVDGIDRKQTDLFLENLVVEKPLQKLWNKKDILKSQVFSLIFCLPLYSVLKTGILL